MRTTFTVLFFVITILFGTVFMRSMSNNVKNNEVPIGIAFFIFATITIIFVVLMFKRTKSFTKQRAEESLEELNRIDQYCLGGDTDVRLKKCLRKAKNIVAADLGFDNWEDLVYSYHTRTGKSLTTDASDVRRKVYDCYLKEL